MSTPERDDLSTAAQALNRIVDELCKSVYPNSVVLRAAPRFGTDFTLELGFDLEDFGGESDVAA